MRQTQLVLIHWRSNSMTRRELTTTMTTYSNCSLPSGTSRVHTHIHVTYIYIYIRAFFFFFVFYSLYKQRNSQHLHHNLIVLFLICVHAVMEQMCGVILLGLFLITSSGQWVTQSGLASITWITRIIVPDIPKNLHIGSTACSRTREVVCCKMLVGIV
jgi:hypothetical protein